MIYMTEDMGECAVCPRTDEHLQIDTEMCIVCYSAYVEGVKSVIKDIERNICFDAKADEDGRCSHHGGKCYELRLLIKSLEAK